MQTWRLARWSEEQFLRRIAREARDNGWLVFHAPSGVGSDPGYPDLHLVRGGESIFWELKVGSERPTEAQVEWNRRLRAAGHRAEFRWPVPHYVEMVALLRRPFPH